PHWKIDYTESTSAAMEKVGAVYGGRPAHHPTGRCCATFKSAPGGFVLLRRLLTDKQQIKQKAQSFD
ncbi:hypothetical protein MJM03_23535, partial [Salmonella enterica subsp. enterica serovar Kentucky]|nr:hypothetical protein [Salmonella enterica subsp. enterica serovar Kentucky]